ncbi:hypothetical protein CC77DRAFT_852974 [Alternaria alternata]|jgi:ABC-type uncharacterized transport system permease subunit|uniref:Uncharacterized protein n=1 Tax=Alternaria alternata TaxID=5599 RepID=A0A177DNT8_ALTAL|nr:hypothetical protein CC77DRAFT_852974 [Alternaria alternata]OAG21136.1 hypothetical protein CC77DRAFT_852974 [Alternaria alternata]
MRNLFVITIECLLSVVLLAVHVFNFRFQSCYTVRLAVVRYLQSSHSIARQIRVIALACRSVIVPFALTVQFPTH